MGPEGAWISEMFRYISYWECLIFYVEHTVIYMNIIKSSVWISEVLLYCAWYRSYHACIVCVLDYLYCCCNHFPAAVETHFLYLVSLKKACFML